MASIIEKKRKNGITYYISYRIPGADGKKIQKWVKCDSKKAALLLIDEVEAAEKANREYKSYTPSSYTGYGAAPGQMTVRELMEKYVEHQCRQKNWGARSYDRSLSHLNNYILPYIGDELVANITTRYLQEFYDDLLTHKAVKGTHRREPENISARTVHDLHKIIRPAFRMAVRLSEIPTNPANDVATPKFESKKREQWTEQEVGEALGECDNEELDTRMSVMFACTLRSGELAGLTWDCVDVSAEAIANNTAHVYVNKEVAFYSRDGIARTEQTVYFTFPTIRANTRHVVVLTNPKTALATRRIYLPATVAKKLAEHKARQAAWKAEAGDIYQDFNLVFALDNGRPLTNNSLGRHFKAYLKRKGIREVDFYSLRHAGATAKLSATKDLKAVQGDMGHSTPQMLLKVYAAIVEKDRLETAAALENGIFAKINAEQDNTK